MNEITSEHTCARVGQVLEELEALRLEMGKGRDARVPMLVRHAAPREVYYAALTVHRKARQLCVELHAPVVSAPEPAAPAKARPGDVMRLLDGVRRHVADARATLDIEDDLPKPELPGPVERAIGKEASDTMNGCLLASRQLNAMLARPFGSDDAKVRLLRALVIAEILLEDVGTKLPPPPPFERRKFPRDVFQVLWRTCEAVYALLRSSGVSVLEITRGFVGEDPSDVHDLASLLVSELEYVASIRGLELPERPSMPVQEIVLPAHNFRLARQLEAAIGVLAIARRGHRGWLTAPKA